MMMNQRREHVNCLHISTYRRLGVSGPSAIPEVQESRPAVLLELVLIQSIILSYLTVRRVTPDMFPLLPAKHHSLYSSFEYTN